VPDSPWKLQQSYVSVLILTLGGGSELNPLLQAGDSFFQGWDFDTGGDPTHGILLV
jgi:hypothetical protein